MMNCLRRKINTFGCCKLICKSPGSLVNGIATCRAYARKIIGVNEDGTYQLSPWECISHRYNVSYCEDKQITLPATYIIFGYSFDIAWGTDWPYSKEFWNNANTVAEDIKILITGGTRTPDVVITVNGKDVYKNDNCPAHEQWIPQ